MLSHDVDSLKHMFADVALEMECEQIRIELRDQLQYQARVVLNGAEARATVKLNNGFRLVIKPAVPGFNSSFNWFKWREFTHPQTGQRVKMSQIRASVKLLAREPDGDALVSLITFGVDAPNMEDLISKALSKIQKHCGLRLVALPELLATNPNHQATSNGENK